MHRPLLISVLLSLLAPGWLQAQPAPPANVFDLNLGVGVGWSDYSLLSLVGSIDRHLGPAFVSTRGTASSTSYGDSFADVGVLVGLRSDYVSLGAGPSLAGIYREDAALHESMHSTDGRAGGDEVLVPGLAVTAMLPLVYATASHPVGLTLYGFANVNREQPFGGLALTLRFRP